MTNYTQWKSLVDLHEYSAIPDSVVSRPEDDDSATGVSNSRGLTVRPHSDFSRFAVRISNMTDSVTRARLYDYSESSYIESVDISGLTSGDVFIFDTAVIAGQDYGVELDSEGGDYVLGFLSDDTNYPYTGEDFDIVARSQDAERSDGTVQSINDIGNPDGVL